MMKKQSNLLFVLLLTVMHGISQTDIYVSNNGSNTGLSLPTISNPVKTLENALTYIKNNLTNSNSEATTPIIFI